MLSLTILCFSTLPVLGGAPSPTLRIGDGRSWTFFNGSWVDGPEGMLAVPEAIRRQDGPAMQGHHYAFLKDAAYHDLRATFEVRLMSHTDAGLIFRAASPRQFYLLHFPNTGQASRAQHFWAALSRMDRDGYLRFVKLELVRRVPSSLGIWLPVDVSIRGDQVQVEIGESGRFEARIDTYRAPGRTGAFLFGAARIRNVRIEGTKTINVPWEGNQQPHQTWFNPSAETEFGKWQKPGQLVRTPAGDLLLNYSVQEEPYRGKITPLTLRSTDSGWTWSKPARLSFLKEDQSAGLHLYPDGKLRMLVYQGDQLSLAETSDDARTWSAPIPVRVGPNPEGLTRTILPGSLVNLADGSVLGFGLSYHESSLEKSNIWQWGSHHTQAYAARSTDNGRTWSDWSSIDNPGLTKVTEGEPIGANLDLTEVCATQTATGKVFALIRPIYSPWMWEASSTDGGRSWGPVVRGPFPGYATPNMLRTQAGSILVAHRLPGLTIHTSLDDGRSFDEGTMIDSAIWVMGSMIEVKRNLVLYVYWDSFESLMRAQFIRVTAEGIEPVRRGSALYR